MKEKVTLNIKEQKRLLVLNEIVAGRMTGQQDAEDATQEAFLRAFRAFDSFDSDRPLAPWLKRIAVNVSLNWLDSAHARQMVSVSDLNRPGGRQFTTDDWSHSRPNPEQILRDSAGLFLLL
jgi:RNA polymerase sigma-70 factor (ECF subfamily)